MGDRPVIQTRIKFLDGEEFVLHVPLARTDEERRVIRTVLGMVIKSWDRAYDPQPCPACRGTGDCRDAPQPLAPAAEGE